MKKLLSTLAIAAASTALAVESSNTFGILRVDSSAEQTIVSIPWEAAGGGSIKVKDVVKTANLTNGDQLYYYANGSYKLWVLEDGVWTGAQTVKDQDGATITADRGTDADVLARGGAIILVRKNPTTGTPAVANPFYLYGQYTTSGSTTTTCVANGYTLLAPPSTDETDLNTKSWTTPGANDNIILQNATVLHYRDVSGRMKWGKLKKELNPQTGVITETVDPTVAKIVAGEGAWYHNNKDVAVTVVWSVDPVL